MILKNSYSYQDFLAAYMECRRIKRNKRSAIAFEARFERNLLQLMREVNSGEYQIGRSEVFVVTWPKPREIWAAQFRDRIVHHLVCKDLTKHVNKILISDTYSCIEGRGTLAASNRLVELHRRETNNYASDCFALQFDIKNYFVSIDKKILWEKLSRIVGDEDKSLTSRLLHQIIWNDPCVNPIIKPNSPFHLVPRHKSLWNTGGKKGLPIGNLTSQIASNVYLDDFDHFVKHTLRCRNYIRYVDDAIILSRNKEYLQYCLEQAVIRLKKIELQIHPDKCTLTPASQGMNFVGYVVKPYRRYPRRSTVHSLMQAAELRSSKKNKVATMNSYLGIIKHANSFNIRMRACRKAAKISGLKHSFEFEKMTG